jgi:hypothetical protein
MCEEKTAAWIYSDGGRLAVTDLLRYEFLIILEKRFC